MVHVGNIIEEAAEVEAEEEQLAASVGIHVRGDTVFRDEVLRNEKDDSRIHFHRYCGSTIVYRMMHSTEKYYLRVECCMRVLSEVILPKQRVLYGR